MNLLINVLQAVPVAVSRPDSFFRAKHQTRHAYQHGVPRPIKHHANNFDKFLAGCKAPHPKTKKKK
jgi:hypothetical protein